jgi:cytochrome P450 family 628
LREYEPRVEEYTQNLIQQLQRFSGEPVDASKWFNYYSFDVMGDLTFGKSFKMLDNGEKHWAIKLLNNGQRGIGVFGPVPWLFVILSQIPGVTKEFNKFIKFCEDMIEQRRAMKTDRADIAKWILQSPPMNDTRFSERAWFMGDSRLIIVAGSDTTAATLTHLFYHLAKEPAHADILRREIVELGGDLSAPKLLNLKHMNGAINESLRMHPPVPGGVARLTPPEGVTIGGTYIPGDINVLSPMFGLGRCRSRVTVS